MFMISLQCLSRFLPPVRDVLHVVVAVRVTPVHGVVLGERRALLLARLVRTAAARTAAGDDGQGDGEARTDGGVTRRGRGEARKERRTGGRTGGRKEGGRKEVWMEKTLEVRF